MSPRDPAGCAREVRELMARGEMLAAYDNAVLGLEQIGDDLELAYLAVLTLARSGALDRAADELTLRDLERRAEPADVHPDLRRDIAALRPRLTKDRALERDGADRKALAGRAAEQYETSFRRHGGSYLCINAATLWLLAGAHDRARALASDALALANQEAAAQGESYWATVTRVEALLVLGRADEAAPEVERAAAQAGTDGSSRATTYRQLRLVIEVAGGDPALLEPLRNPTVVHFCGHRSSPGEGARFPAAEEQRVRSAVEALLDAEQVGVGFGSLACGADIIVAEVLLERGAELNVVLPFAKDEFIEQSVATGGAGWVDRFQRCLAAATSVVFANDDEFLDDDTLFTYCSQIAMGDAVLRSRFLAADAFQLAVWDGQDPIAEVGTGADVRAWSGTGLRTVVVPPRSGEIRASRPAPARTRRRIRAMLFADVAGFSTLRDAQVLAFVDEVLGPIAKAIDGFPRAVLRRQTWGDGIHIVFDGVAAAGACALAIQRVMGTLDLDGAGLGSLRGMRVGCHVGPVFETFDPVMDEPGFGGAHITRTARIEPRTPVGEVYVTHAFAAAAMLHPENDWTCQYVGHVPTAKDYGVLPMYVLRDRAPRGASA